MAQQPPPPAGWYPAPHADNEMRYWDGVRWLDTTPPPAMPPLPTVATPEPTRLSTAAPSTKTPTRVATAPPPRPGGVEATGGGKGGIGWKVGTFIAGALALIFFVAMIAALAGTGGSSDAQVRAELNRAEAALIPQEEVERRNGDLDTREESLSAREADIEAREAALGETEAMAARTSFSDGIQVIGQTIEPGVYRTDDPDSCIWYIYTSGSNYEDVINSGYSGDTAEVTVVLAAGQDFDSSDCGTWNKVG